MKKEKVDILIDKLILNEISELELTQLEAAISESPKIRNEINFRKDINKSMEYLGNEDLRKLLNRIHEEEIEGKTAPKKHHWKIPLFFLFALGIALLIYQFTKPVKISSHLVYAEYFSPYPSSEERGEDEAKLIQGFKAHYSDKNYQKALDQIKPILNTQNNEMKLMAGICALESDDFHLSTQLFNDILSTKDYYFQDHANWYLALTYLKQDKIKEAITILTQLKNNPKADHHKQAMELLKKIR